MSKAVIFFRQFRTYLEFRVDSNDRQIVTPAEISKMLKLESVIYIKGQHGEYLSILNDIDLNALESQKYEVGGVPIDDVAENECNSDQDFDLTVSSSTRAAFFERQIWNDVVLFLSSGSFPKSKKCSKARENFSRRCRSSYTLGLPDADGPTLYFTSGGRSKVPGMLPTFHPEYKHLDELRNQHLQENTNHKNKHVSPLIR
jgi:hypothetical protein